MQFQSLSSCIVNTVCSASVSSSHTGHTFFAHSALPPNDISTDTNISGVDGHVAFCLILVVVANISGTFFELIVVEGPEYIAFTFDAIYHSSIHYYYYYYYYTVCVHVVHKVKNHKCHMSLQKSTTVKFSFEAGLKSAEADRQIRNDKLGQIVPDYWYGMAECTFGKFMFVLLSCSKF